MSNAGFERVGIGKSLWTLMKAQLLTSFRFNEMLHEKDKKKHSRSIVYFITMIFLFCMLVGYSYLIGLGLNLIGMAEAIPSMAFTICCMMSLFFTMLKSVVTLFGFKDYDMLMCLPIKSTVVITSKFLYMYIVNELLTIGIMLPIGTAYAQFAGFHPMDLIIWILGTITAPLIPMTIATMAGAAISAVVSRMKHKNLFSVIFSFAMIFAIMVFNICLNSSDSDAMLFLQMKEISTMLIDKMSSLYPPVRLFQESVTQHNLLPLLVLILISVGWYLIFVNVVAASFNKINTKLKAHNAKTNYKMQELQTSTPVMALFKKEVARFLSSPGYIVNTTVGTAMALIFSVFCVIKGPDSVIQTFAGEDFGGFTQGALCAIPFFASALLAMTCTSSVSLSLEGKNLWIIKSLPLEPQTILQSKILFDLSIKLSTSVVCGILLLIAFKPTSFAVAVWYLLTPVAFAVLSSMWGMFLNVKFPNYEWENEMVVIKQGAASGISIFSGMIFGGLIGVAVLLLGIAGFSVAAAAVSTLIIAVMAFGLYRVLMKATI